MMTFAQFLNLQHLSSDIDPDMFDGSVLLEAVSPTMAKAAAAGILLKVGQLNRKAQQDRTANSADKTLANMQFWVASMLAIAIGTMTTPDRPK